MTGRIYHPEEKHPEPYQHEMNPDASKGLNYGTAGAPKPLRSAFDVKQLHELLSELSSDELKQIFVLEQGARLETKAAYLKISGNQIQEIRALGDEDVGPDDIYLPKDEMPYQLWNRLIGRDHPNATKQG